jgi:hypothetical protein
MNNEPVAWMDGEGGFYHNDDYEVCKEHNIADDLIPLYTHPVELTDKEIIEQANHLADGWFSNKFEKGIFITEEKLVDLVKAILRKAQEK